MKSKSFPLDILSLIPQLEPHCGKCSGEVEALAQQFLLSLMIGGPNILPDAEIERLVEKLNSNGPRTSKTWAAKGEKA